MEEQHTDTLSCMIVDDEIPAHKILTDYVGQVSWLSLVDGYYRGLDALDAIPAVKPDILFLDVEMPDLNGLKLLELIKKNKASVILTTAHVNFAVDGYLYDPAGFLLKPIFFEKFIETLVRVRHSRSRDTDPYEHMLRHNSQDELCETNQQTEQQKTLPSFLATSMWVKVDKRHVQIEYSQITMIEGARNYVRIYQGNQFYTTRVPFWVMMRGLPRSLFIIASRSFIVNRLEVKELDGNELLMKTDARIKVSRELRAMVLDKLTNG